MLVTYCFFGNVCKDKWLYRDYWGVYILAIFFLRETHVKIFVDV